jgi:hypothetical protein
MTWSSRSSTSSWSYAFPELRRFELRADDRFGGRGLTCRGTVVGLDADRCGEEPVGGQGCQDQCASRHRQGDPGSVRGNRELTATSLIGPGRSPVRFGRCTMQSATYTGTLKIWSPRFARRTCSTRTAPGAEVRPA